MNNHPASNGRMIVHVLLGDIAYNVTWGGKPPGSLLRWNTSHYIEGKIFLLKIKPVFLFPKLIPGRTMQLKGVAIFEVLTREKTNGNTEQVVNDNPLSFSIRIVWLKIGILG